MDDDTATDSDDDEEKEEVSDSDEATSSESEDEYDDTADIQAAAAIDLPRPPRGLKIDDNSKIDENDVIGRQFFYKIAGAPLKREEFGWYFCKIAKKLTESEKKNPENKDCTHYARFEVNVDFKNQKLCNYAPRAKGKAAPRVIMWAISTSAESRGARWLLTTKL